MDIEKIANLFSHEEIKTVEKIDGGHINSSYLVSTIDNNKFILQKINQNVFKKPVWIVDNLVRINDQLIASDYPYQVAKLRHTKNNKPYYHDKSGFWRAAEYIKNSKTILVCTNAETAHKSANAYGLFVKASSGFNLKDIKTVIPDFHDPQKRYNELELAVAVNYKDRISAAKDLISQAKQHQYLIKEYKSVLTNLPIRLVHNDTKISNLLFSEDLNKVNAIIDLDTVMPGYLINDFGDMVRSFCNPAAEDETDLNKVKFDFDIYDALLNGYLYALKDIITLQEKSALLIGIKTIIYIQFIRFLSDNLSGDTYYRIEYKDQNLKRAKVQLKLLMQIIDRKMN